MCNSMRGLVIKYGEYIVMLKGFNLYDELYKRTSCVKDSITIVSHRIKKFVKGSGNNKIIFELTGLVVPLLVFFDFDRTLCVHDYPMQYQGSEDYEDECYSMLNILDVLHEKDRPLKCMQWIARKLRDNGAKLFCLTHEIFNLRNGYKIEFLNKNYADTPMKLIAVDSPSHKIDMIKAIARSYNIPLSKCMIIDDRMPTIIEANAAGIQAYHISNVMLWYEERY